MGRYDWPAGALPRDDARARQSFNTRFRPTPDVRLPDGSLPPLPPQPRRRRRGVARAQPAAAPYLWLPIGPSGVHGGQASGSPRVAGRIRDVAVDPTDGKRVYAASGSGGVWFSPNRGESWQPLDEFAVSPNRHTLFPIGNTLACGALFVRWGIADNGAGDEVFVGTGEPGDQGGMPGGHVAGIGILSALGPATGASWTVAAPDLRGHAVWRIVDDPGNPDQLFAATTDGLYEKPQGGEWAKVASLGLAPGIRAEFNEHVIDVVVTRLSGPDRVRIWVARYGVVQVADVVGPAPPPAPLNLAGLAFQNVNLGANRAPGARVVLALGAPNELWVLSKKAMSGAEKHEPAHMWRINAAAALNALTVTEISGVPSRLFMSTGDQSMYDMGLTVHPANTNRLYAAGAAEKIEEEYNGALYRLDVAGTTATPELIGKGVHSDCHVVRCAPGPGGGVTRAVWVGCDGGLFRSDLDGNPGTFEARNTGLAVLQPGFVACHPTNDGIVAAGMQDNGTCVRVGDTLWREPYPGDGGGVVYDPAHANRYFRQYINAHWRSSDDTGISAVWRRNARNPDPQKTSEAVESARALFYTAAGAMVHGGTTHFAFGTDRVWYTPDWGSSWVTLPTGTDPRALDSPLLDQDVMQPGTANGEYTDTVGSTDCCSDSYHGAIYDKTAGIMACRWSARADAGGRHRVRLNVLWDGGLAVIEGSRPTGSAEPWTWVKTKVEPIRTANTPAEQTALDAADPLAFLPGPGLVNDVCVHDPASGTYGSCYLATVGSAGTGPGKEVDTVWWYDGDSHFIPCGLRRVHPRATFPAGQHIAAPALSVLVDPDDSKVVYVGTSVGVVKGELTIQPDGPHWVWANFDNGLPEGAVHDLAFFKHDMVKLLRAALQSRGVWEVDLAVADAQPRTFLRVYRTDTRRRRPTPLSGPATNGPDDLRWDASPDVVFDRTGRTYPAGGPGEADLFEVPKADAATAAAESFGAATFKVHVLVHHRWHAEAAAASVKVALLRHDGPDFGSVPLGGVWAELVAIAGGDPVPGSLSGGWVKAAAQLVKPLTAPVDARTPRAVTFDVDVSAVADGTRVTFLAVVMSAADQITAAEIVKADNTPAATVAELVLHSRHAAARTLRRG